VARDTYFKNTVGQEPWELRGTASTAAATAVSAALPVGVITAYYGATAPTGWLLCDGAAIPAAYATLIALVGANTPNLKGKVIVGRDAADIDFDTLGETGGAKTVALVTGELASHGHSHNHGSNNVGAESGHTHSEIASGQGNIQLTAGVNDYNLNFATVNTGGSSGHTHTFTPTTDATTAGSGTAHQNLQPYIAISYIIKAQ
jgi:microcystin-dependent protein